MLAAVEPLARRAGADSDSVLLTVLLGVFIVSALCAPTMGRIAGNYFKQLFRSHREFLPSEKTLGERLVVTVSLLQTLTFEGMILYCALGAAGRPPIMSLAGVVLLCSLLLVVQLAGYRLVGYAFATPDESQAWQSAFFITQGICGYLLAVPAFAMLFYPNLMLPFLIAAGVIFAACRIPLYISEFRIFHIGNLSVIYFFLYLCTLEIVPLLAVWSLAGAFSSIFC